MGRMPEETPGGRVLIVDDEPSLGEVLSISLKKAGYTAAAETDPVRALERVRTDGPDVVVQDLKMPQMDGLELLRRIKQVRPETIVIIMTAFSDWDRAVEAMRAGAYDYLRKPFDEKFNDVKRSVARALGVRSFQNEQGVDFEEALTRIGLMVGDSLQMKQVRDLIRRVAPTDSSVLVTGESGTGKELAARALHYFSPRSRRPFATVNCGAIPETLMESELFGHVRGAFTGAVADKVGLLEVAAGGTFFFDEISEMSPALQVKLLRVLEEREFKPVGGLQTRHADVRFVAATNRNLEAEVREGRFRKDLFYRLNVIPLELPPLRQRREDVSLLAGYFLRRFSGRTGKPITGFSDAAREAMLRYGWPGNIRELENSIERAVAFCDGRTIGVEHLPEPVVKGHETARRAPAPSLPAEGVDLDRRLAEFERWHLQQALERTGGNMTEAAALLKMSVRSFRYRLGRRGARKEDDADAGPGR
jgi:two-component system response regulator PilR (NtrC family)